MKDFARQFYYSTAWKDCRTAYKKQAGGLCEVCAAKGLIAPGDIVHHIVHITPKNINDPTVTLNAANLQLVCRDCHAEIHRKKTKRYKVGDDGRVYIPLCE